MSAPRRWKCVCAYDGGAFAGWQSQPGGRGVQDAIERRLAEIFGAAIRIHASGRTDAGVHARGQVFHFEAAWPRGAEQLRSALRGGLHPGIQMRSVGLAAPDFHARFSATGKIYDYWLHLGDADPFVRPYAWILFKPLALPAMQRAASLLRGRHDFKAFSAESGSNPADTVRDLRRLEIGRRGRRMRIVAEADGFLYKMVRSLVGALVSVGEGRLDAGDLPGLLASRRRIPAVQTAPPQGLFLRRVLYGAGSGRAGSGSAAPAEISDE